LPRLIGLGRALDLILTGRPVYAQEALSIGLANRVVPIGTSREAAEQLAAQIAAFPQIGLRNERLSAYEQFGMEFGEAMANEFRRGLSALQHESTSGASRFAGGAGRHGRFQDPSYGGGPDHLDSV
jgi:enoyl-CoA hydratase